MFITLMSGLIAGPAVSFSGSPTVSPVSRCFVFFAAFAGVRFEIDGFVFNHFLRVVPRATRVRHEYGEQLAGDDHAGQKSGQSDDAEPETVERRNQQREQAGADQFFLRFRRAKCRATRP